LGREHFSDGEGGINTVKVYRELISGHDIGYESKELLRVAVILNPSKEEMKDMIEMSVRKHRRLSDLPPKQANRNSTYHRIQAYDVFGLTPKRGNSIYYDRINR